MSPDYDVHEALQLNHERLGTVVPKRLQELRLVIESFRHRLEPWHADLFIKILLSVERVCHDLLKTTEQEALPAAAWNA